MLIALRVFSSDENWPEKTMYALVEVTEPLLQQLENMWKILLENKVVNNDLYKLTAWSYLPEYITYSELEKMLGDELIGEIDDNEFVQLLDTNDYVPTTTQTDCDLLVVTVNGDMKFTCYLDDTSIKLSTAMVKIETLREMMKYGHK